MTLAMVNEGIGGNTVIDVAGYDPPVNSPTGVDRLDRDVLSHSGISHVVLFEGTNDIRRGATADQLIAGMKTIVAKVKAKGIKIIGVTIIPRHAVVPGRGRHRLERGKVQNPRPGQSMDQERGRLRCRAGFRRRDARSRPIRKP